MTPATLLSSARCCRVAWPMELATAPSTMNTRLNPMMNIIEFSITERMSLESWCFSSSTPAPEMSETYPGTSGRTQGERNEIRPAKNAASGSGSEDMKAYCSNSEAFACGYAQVLGRCACQGESYRPRLQRGT